jgi:hypothetical protein
MGIGYWNTLATLQAAGPTLSGSAATRTSLLNAQAKISLPAGFFAYAGQKLKVVAQGQLTNAATPGTVLFDVGFGATGTTIVFSSGALGMSASAHTTLPFWLEIDFTVRTLGSGTAATFMPQGRVTGKPFNATAAGTDNAATETTLMMPGTVPATTTFDSTIVNLVDFAATTSLSTAAVTLQQYELISTNWGG